MPTVPKYRKQTSPTALSGGQTNIHVPDGVAGGSGGLIKLGGDMDAVSEQLGKIGFDIKQKEDKRLSKQAYLDAKNAARQLLWGQEKDGQALGLMLRQGKNAEGIFDHAQKGLDDIKKKYGGQMTNATQRELFSRFFDSDMSAMLDSAQGHQMKQMHALDVATTDALVDDAMLDLTTATTPDARREAVAGLDAALTEKGRLQGLSAEQIQDIKLEKTTAAHATVVKRMIAADQFEAARGYLKKHGFGEGGLKEINPDAMAGLEQSVKDGMDTKQATTLNATIRAEMPHASLTQKLERARGLAGENDALYRKLEDQVRGEDKLLKSDYAAGIVKKQEGLIDAYFNNPSAETVEALQKAVDEEVDPKTKAQMAGTLRQLTANRRTVSVAEKRTELEARIAADDITVQEAKVKYAPFLSDDDWKRLSKEIGDSEAVAVRRWNLGFDSWLEKNIGTTKAAEKKVKMFKEHIEIFAKDFESKNSRKPTAKELTEYRDHLLSEVIYDAGDGVFNLEDSIPRYLLETVYDDPEFDVNRALEEAGWTKDTSGYQDEWKRVYDAWAAEKGVK